MAQLQKVESQTELKCHADKFFEIWAHKPFLVPKLCSKKFQKVELNEGECWDRVGAVITWSYFIDEIGEHATIKTRVEECNDESRSVKYSHHAGHIVEKYYKKTLISKIEATPKANGEGCTIKWSFEYEKMDENAPEPVIYANYLIGAAKDIDACLSNA